jgi:hypothetical protein
MEIQVLARLKPTKYPERAKDVHSNNGIAWSGWAAGCQKMTLEVGQHGQARLISV